MKKIAVLFLCFALLLSSFASCKGNTSSQTVGESDTFSSLEEGIESQSEAYAQKESVIESQDTASNSDGTDHSENGDFTEATEAPSEKEPQTETEKPTEKASEQLSSEKNTHEAVSDSPSEEPSEEDDESSASFSESMSQFESETVSGETEEELPIGSLDEELAYLGITGYDSYKLMMVSLYYEFYYIGGELPNARQIARSVRSLFDEYFLDIDTSDIETMTTAVIACYQQAVGDQYATYFDKESYRTQQADQDAEFVGIGVYVSYSMTEGSVQVLSVFEGTPAAEAGILPGDYLVSVDGVGIEEIGYYELVNRIRGEVDSYVTVGVLRNGESLSFTMQRKTVQGISVTYRQLAQDENIGYVKIEQFDSKTAEQFKKAINELILCGVEGFIFDLRGNPGGEVGAIVDVLDYLLPDGKMIARFRYDVDISGGRDTVYIADDGHEVTLPMTVLCDNYTASAGELFTAALRDHEAATVIGVTTYGKGTAQTVIELGDGTAFTISVARYDPPSGENYEGMGITPHIVVELSEEAAAVNAFLRDDLIDNQLQTAVTEINRLREAALQ